VYGWDGPSEFDDIINSNYFDICESDGYMRYYHNGNQIVCEPVPGIPNLLCLDIFKVPVYVGDQLHSFQSAVR